ncbi:MAG: RnfABCDGE type electron transport complex subunit D [Bacteroidales bacterium]|jgi:electron transport complex protein RnfD|nr:RnfABCDGE type electron transport complex subunit D [Bacteroidales bacterium]NLM93865.1 RnfABCDGE type electron transport complex subunit D [Bacteroidales bacterium]
MSLLTVSGSPHVHDSQSVSKIMFGVVISLIPAMLVSFYFFGLAAILLTLTAVVSCMAVEFVIQKYLMKGPVTIFDGSAVITGVLLAFNVPANLPLWMVVIGSIVAIGVGKMTFGGLGKNPFNPALVGRVFLMISFPVHMTNYPKPTAFSTQLTDIVTGPTPLAIMKEGLQKGESVSEIIPHIPEYAQLLLGQMGGSMGEISALALLLGGLFMLFKKIITWHVPVAYLGTVLVFTGIFWLADPGYHFNPIYHLLSGGLMLGALYMATDMVTSPMSKGGMLIFGVGCGVLTVIIRMFGAYPEGVAFSILIMNAFVPLINRSIKPRRFGEEVKNG